MNMFGKTLLVTTFLVTAQALIAMEQAPAKPQEPEKAVERLSGQALIAELAKAVKENNFARYFLLLSREPLEKQYLALIDRPLAGNGSRAIHFAAHHGNNNALKALIQLGAAFDEPNNHGMTPFLFAACVDNTNGMAFLLSQGANKNAVDINHGNALHGAVHWRHLPTIRMLVNDYGFDPKLLDKNRVSPLDLAIVDGCVDIINALLCRSTNPDVAEPGRRGGLFAAAFFGKIEAMELLIKDYGFDVNRRDEKQYTPLHHAASQGNIEAINILIRNGAQKDAVDAYGGTALDMAAANGQVPTLVSLMRNHGMDPNSMRGLFAPLHLAALGGHTEAIHALIREGANVNLVSTSGWNALHCAAQRDNVQALISLIKDYGLDPQAKTTRDRTPFNMASNCLAQCALLVCGAHVSAEEKKRCCYSDLVTEENKQTLLQALMENQKNPFDPNIRYGAEQSTALIYAAQRKCLSCVKRLLSDPRTDLNIQNNQGKTALHYVVVEPLHADTYEVCSLLLNTQRMNTALKDTQEKTAFALNKDAANRYNANILKKYTDLFELRKMKVQLYLSLKHARCSDTCTDSHCSHRAQLPPDICLKIARLLTQESLPKPTPTALSRAYSWFQGYFGAQQ